MDMTVASAIPALHAMVARVISALRRSTWRHDGGGPVQPFAETFGKDESERSA